MARLLKISLLLLIVGSSNVSCAKVNKNEKKLIHKAVKALGKLPGIIGQAFELYEMFENLNGIFNPEDGPQDTDSRLDMLNDKMDKLSSDMQAFENRLSNQIYIQGVSNELQLSLKDFNGNIFNIDNFYTKFVDYVNDTLVFEERDLKSFAKDATAHSELGVGSILRKIQDIFIHNQGKSKNIPTLLLNGEISQDFMCALKQSPQQIIHTLFQKMVLTEVRGYAMLIFSYEILNAIEDSKKKTSHKDQAMNLAKKRIRETFSIVKEIMKYASRETWKCDPGHPIENKHYARFGPVFQRYILYERDAYDIKTERTKACAERECSSIRHVKHKCKDTGCDPQHCYGNVRDCERKGKHLSYCLADDEYRRYQYIEIDDKEYGSNTTCPFNVAHTHDEFGNWLIGTCSYCVCTCEDTAKSIDKYISLQPVYSDYSENKVITGAQIQLEDNTFTIQIKQATLLPNGHIDTSTDDWKTDETLEISSMENDVDYYEITWDTKTICLDDLDSKSSPYKHHVLTGLQFVNVDGRLQLAIHLSRFNFKTGVVDDKKPKVHYNDQEKRSIFSLDNRDVPIGHGIKNPKPLPVGDKCFELTTSDFKKDAGQNVLPFIDTQRIDTNPSMPLSGAGLFIRSDDKDASGGYLALKLFTLNLQPYMKLTEEEKKLSMVED